jgi:hypothetical protein
VWWFWVESFCGFVAINSDASFHPFNIYFQLHFILSLYCCYTLHVSCIKTSISNFVFDYYSGNEKGEKCNTLEIKWKWICRLSLRNLGRIEIGRTAYVENIKVYPQNIVGRDVTVGVATRYGLDGPGIESRWGRDFPNPSRPAVVPTQLPIQWVRGIFRG